MSVVLKFHTSTLKKLTASFLVAISVFCAFSPVTYSAPEENEDFNGIPTVLQPLSRLIARYPDDPDYYEIRAECFLKLDGRQISDGKERAIEDLDKAIALNPNSFSALELRAILKWELFDFEGAWEDLDKAIALKPDSFSALKLRAILKSELFDFKGAWKDLHLASKAVKNKKQREDLLFTRLIIGIREKNALGTIRGEPIDTNAE